jgi:SAM-dependent methyltransferase
MSSSSFTGQTYLQSQYGSKTNLQIRVETHEKYSFPRQDFTAWVLDQISWRGRERVIDVGCGSGIYTRPTQQRAGHYLAGDLSLGMLRSLPADVTRINLDVQHLPLADESVDVILANHMLYHVPNQDAAAAHFARVLRPGGTLLAATNTSHNRRELNDLVSTVARELHIPIPEGVLGDSLLSFTLENGQTLLERHFAQVERYDLASEFVFPAPEPAIAYIGTTRELLLEKAPPGVTWETIVGSLYKHLSAHIAQHGEFRVHKMAGVFVCYKVKPENGYTD